MICRKVYKNILVIAVAALGQALLCQESKENTLDSLSSTALKKLQTNNYYDALRAIDEMHTVAVKEKDSTFMARSENLYGLTYINLYSYDEAENHFKKAIAFNELSKDTNRLALNYANIAHLTMLKGDFEKSEDALAKSKFYDAFNNNKIDFYNYETEVILRYKQAKYDSLIKVAEIPLKELYTTGFTRTSYKDEEWRKLMEQRYLITFELYLAYALIESGRDLEKANALLNKHKEKKLEEILWYNSQVYEQYYKLNYYKEKYFLEQATVNKDSVLYYEKLSKTYFQEAVNFLKDFTANNNEFFATALQNEEKIKHLEMEALANKKQNSYTRNLTYLLAFLGIVISFFLAYYITSNKRIKTINVSLDQTNRALKKLIENRSKFLAVVSHEIRTPLYALQELIFGIPDAYEDEEESEEYALATYSILNLRHTVDNSLQFSRFNYFDKEVEINPQPTDLVGLMNELKEYFKIILRINEVEMDLLLNLQNTVFKLSKSKISHVLNNLIKNAIEFEGVTNILISVTEKSLSDNSSQLVFSVIDNGPGITPEVISYVEQGEVHISDENSNRGIKLGLILCNQILGLMGSQLEFNNSLSSNTVSFALTLEVSENPYLKSQSKSKNTIKKILYVDNNVINLLITQRLINSIGYECVTVDAGSLAIEEVKRTDFDLILMDINMPGMDGFETSTEIYKINSDIPIIAYTALSRDEIWKKCHKAHIKEVLTKPLTSDEFARVLKKYLDKPTFLRD